MTFKPDTTGAKAAFKPKGTGTTRHSETKEAKKATTTHRVGEGPAKVEKKSPAQSKKDETTKKTGTFEGKSNEHGKGRRAAHA
jgi:hypothetical protein